VRMSGEGVNIALASLFSEKLVSFDDLLQPSGLPDVDI
jgi:hypothetical protein